MKRTLQLGLLGGLAACQFEAKGSGANDSAGSNSGSATDGGTTVPTSTDTADTTTAQSDSADSATSGPSTSSDESTTSAGSDATSDTSSETGSTTAGCTPTLWYLDDDGDGFGDPDTESSACDAPSGEHVEAGGDCDDGVMAINPDADEICDDLDNDCDLGVDEGSPSNGSCDGCDFYLSNDTDHYFAHCPGPLEYTDAREACEVYGPAATLAIVDDPVDDAVLAGLDNQDVWLGIDDLDTEGDWLWNDGQGAILGGVVMGYDGWGPGEPNGGATENCAEYDPGVGGWNDGICDGPQPYFCRHPV